MRRSLAGALALLLFLAPPAAAYEGRYTVTAYCLRGPTASHPWTGAYAGPGVIAAGPSIPFGTRLHIEGWGDGVVLDRGVPDGHLDVWAPSCWWATHVWERRTVWVTPTTVVPSMEVAQESAPEEAEPWFSEAHAEGESNDVP